MSTVHLYTDKPVGDLLWTNPWVVWEYPYSEQWGPNPGLDQSNRPEVPRLQVFWLGGTHFARPSYVAVQLTFHFLTEEAVHLTFHFLTEDDVHLTFYFLTKEDIPGLLVIQLLSPFCQINGACILLAPVMWLYTCTPWTPCTLVLYILAPAWPQ